MVPLPETEKFSNVFPAQRPRAGRAAAILENLLEDPTVHEMASRPLAQFDLILAWASWKLLWAT